MKRVHLLLTGCLALILLVLSGCSQPNVQPTVEGTIEDIFTTPPSLTVTTAPTESASQTTLPPQQIPEETVDMSGMSFHFRFDAEYQQDDLGKYLAYDGNEMHITYVLGGKGAVVEKGYGILLFVNGQPQPYRTGEDDTLRLIHTFYPPPDGIDHEFDLYFTPVDGRAGETGSLYAALLHDPDYSLSEGTRLPRYTEERIGAGMVRFLFLADPPQTQHADYESRVISLSTGYTEVKFKDIAGWSDDDLLEKVEFDFYVNGSNGTGGSIGTIHYSVPSSDPVDIHLEVWGKAGVKYAVVLFVDNKPVLLGDGGILTVETKSGEKVVVDAQLDISDSDGECVIYGMLVPLNGISTGSWDEWSRLLITWPFFVCTQSYEEIRG